MSVTPGDTSCISGTVVVRVSRDKSSGSDWTLLRLAVLVGGIPTAVYTT